MVLPNAETTEPPTAGHSKVKGPTMRHLLATTAILFTLTGPAFAGDIHAAFAMIKADPTPAIAACPTLAGKPCAS